MSASYFHFIHAKVLKFNYLTMLLFMLHSHKGYGYQIVKNRIKHKDNYLLLFIFFKVVFYVVYPLH